MRTIFASRRFAALAVNITHGFSHMSNQGLAVLYPVLREQFGFGYTGIAFLSTVNQLVEGPMQVTFGILTRLLRRTHILGMGSILAFLGMAGIAGSQSYGHLLVGKVVRGLGTSPNHPVGGAVMAYSFPQARARALGLHHTAGNIGGWVAPLAMGALLYFLGWRLALLVLSLPLLVLGLLFFVIREPGGVEEGSGLRGQSAASRARLGLREYKAIVKDRNAMLLALVMMVGAAGRGTGVLNTYLPAFLVDRYHISVSLAALFLAAYTFGGIVGPLAMGWLADRTSPKLAVRLDLFLSALFALSILLPETPGLALGVLVFWAGFFIWARSSLIQSLLIRASPQGTRIESLLSLYFTLSALTGPFWLLLTGVVVDRLGIAAALGVMAASYLVGIALLGLIRLQPHQAEDKAPQARA